MARYPIKISGQNLEEHQPIMNA